MSRQVSQKQATRCFIIHVELLESSINELAAITGISAHIFDCPSLSNKLIDSLNPRSLVNASPYVKRAVAGATLAKEQLKRDKQIQCLKFLLLP